MKSAAKLVETVAFDMAEDVPAAQVESLLGLVCRIEAAAAKLVVKP